MEYEAGREKQPPNFLRTGEQKAGYPPDKAVRCCAERTGRQHH